MKQLFLTIITLLFTLTHLYAQDYLWQQSEVEKSIFKKNNVKLRVGIYSTNKTKAPDSAFTAYYNRNGQVVRQVSIDPMIGFVVNLNHYANGNLQQVATFEFSDESNLQKMLFDMPFEKLKSRLVLFFDYTEDSLHIEDFYWGLNPELYAKYSYNRTSPTGLIPLTVFRDNQTTVDTLYFQNGRLLKTVRSSNDSTVQMYNNLGLLMDKSIFRKGTLVYQASYEYNNEGFPTKETISRNGEISSVMDYSYVFYENNEESYSYLWAPFEKSQIELAPKVPEIYTVVEARPQIIGGLQELYKHVVYSKKSMKKGIEGRVIVEFTVDEKGNTSDFKILQNPGGDLGKSVINAIKKVKFTPGMQRGRPVKVRYTLPVTFSLSPK